MSDGEVKRGVLLCGTGLGMSYTANRHPHVRAAVAWTSGDRQAGARAQRRQRSRASGALRVGADKECDILKTWLDTPFEGGRHARRVEKIEPKDTNDNECLAQASRCARPGAALREADPEIAALIDEETDRQNDGLELIASENFVSPAVLEAMGSPLTNKYAEGLPGKRYYGGCEVVDKVEQLAIDRAKQLFGADHANVQPHSGAQANYAAMSPFLKPGDTFLGMDLSNGGHLTHGSPVNFSGMLYQGDLVRRHRRRLHRLRRHASRRRASTSRS